VTHVDSILSAWNGASVCTSLFDKPQISIVSRPCRLHSSECTYLQKNNGERSFTDRTQGTLPRKTCEHQSDSWKGLNVSEDLRQGWAA
jgi:hypothetical protein